MAPGPDELAKIHDDFWMALADIIPADVMDSARRPGSVEDDILRAVQALVTERAAAVRFFSELQSITLRNTRRAIVTHVKALADKAWAYDDLSR